MTVHGIFPSPSLPPSLLSSLLPSLSLSPFQSERPVSVPQPGGDSVPLQQQQSGVHPGEPGREEEGLHHEEQWVDQAGAGEGQGQYGSSQGQYIWSVPGQQLYSLLMRASKLETGMSVDCCKPHSQTLPMRSCLNIDRGVSLVNIDMWWFPHPSLCQYTVFKHLKCTAFFSRNKLAAAHTVIT